MEGLTSDDFSEPSSPLMLIPIFFNIKRVLKKLTSINPPIAPFRDTGNGSKKAAMNQIAMYKLIHFRAYSNKCLIVRNFTHYASPSNLYIYYTTNPIKANGYIAKPISYSLLYCLLGVCKKCCNARMNIFTQVW
jgi:hypothetical protein